MKKRYWLLLGTPLLLVLLVLSPFILMRAGYDVGYPVAPTGNTVSSSTELAVGDDVLAVWNGSWWKAEVLEVHPSGKVKIHYSQWSNAWDEFISCERLQLPHARATP